MTTQSVGPQRAIAEKAGTTDVALPAGDARGIEQAEGALLECGGSACGLRCQ